MANLHWFKCKQCNRFQQEEFTSDRRLRWYCKNCNSSNLYVDNKETAPTISTKAEEGRELVSDIAKKIKKDNIAHDLVNHPTHYNNHPSGIECIQITEHMNFCLGNAIKYIWRASLKNGLEDLEKAVWYINREIEKLKAKK